MPFVERSDVDRRVRRLRVPVVRREIEEALAIRQEPGPAVRSCAVRVSRVVTGAGLPPAAGMRESPPRKSAAKTMTPPWPQLPPRGVGASQRTCTGPPAASIVLSFPPEKKPMDRLSEDQNGKTPRSVAGDADVMPLDTDWTHNFPEAPNTIRAPSGETAGGADSSPVSSNAVFSGRQDERMNGRRPRGAGANEADRQREGGGGGDERDRPREPGAGPAAGDGHHRCGCRCGCAGVGSLPDPAQLPLQVARRLPALLGILGEAGPHDPVERRRRRRLRPERSASARRAGSTR